MPFSNNSKSNSSKKSKRLRRSLNKKNLMVSPEPTQRDIPDIENHNIEEVSIEISQVSMSSMSKSKKNSKKSAHKKKQSNHNKKQGPVEKSITATNVIQYQEKIELEQKPKQERSRPCAKCREFYFEPLLDEETEIARIRQRAFDQRGQSRRRNRRQRLKESDSKTKKLESKNNTASESAKLKRPFLPGCDDSNLGPYVMYKTMLKQEREHFEKINRIVYEQSEKFEGILSKPDDQKENGGASSNVLQQLEVNSLQRISDSFCNDSFTSAAKQKKKIEITMPQKNLCDLRNKVVDKTIFGVGSRLKQNSLTQHLAVKLFDLVFMHQQQFHGNHDQAVDSALSLASVTKGTLKDVRNEEKNLQLLAAQCILLASKFVETSRIYPAEVVYQVKGWGRADFDLLRSGQVEEYILNMVDFDLIMLSPADFIGFYTKCWNMAIPVHDCSQKIPSKIREFWQSETEQKTFQVLCHQICDLMVSNLGPKISLLYLPSQVAAAAIQMAMQSLVGFGKHVEKLEINVMKAFLEENSRILGYSKESQDGIQSLINEAEQIEIIRLYLGIKEINRQSNSKDMQTTQDTSCGWSDSPFKLADKIQTPAFTPHKFKSDMALSPVKQRTSAGSPGKKGRSSKRLPRISFENLIKFQKFVRNRKIQSELRESLLSDCVSVDSSLFHSEDSYTYPRYVNTELESNYIITHRFFGPGQYKNTKNGRKLRESLKNEPARHSIIPSLEVVDNVEEFYGNSHLQLKKQQSSDQSVRYMDLLETPQAKKPYRKLNVSEATFCSNSSSTASKKADKENQRRTANLQPRRSAFLGQNFECNPADSLQSDREADDETIRPLFTKIAEQPGMSDEDVRATHERNPFEDSEYMRKVNDFQRATGGHYSLIPRALQEQHMSDFEYNSNDDVMDYYPFCKGQNFILSQQPSQLNFHPAPRHSMPERFLHLSQLENMVDSGELELAWDKDCMEITENEVPDANNGQQSSTTNSSTKLMTARNTMQRAPKENLAAAIEGYVPLRGPKRRECFV